MRRSLMYIKRKLIQKYLTDKERFTILGSLLEGDDEDMYKRCLLISDKSIALDNVCRGLKLAYG